MSLLINFADDVGNGVLSALQWVADSNYKLVEGSLSLLCEVYMFLATLGSDFKHHHWNLFYYVYEVFCECCNLWVSTLRILNKIFAILAHIGYTILTWIDVSVTYMLSSTIWMANHWWICIQNIFSYCGLSSENVTNLIIVIWDWFLDSCASFVYMTANCIVWCVNMSIVIFKAILYKSLGFVIAICDVFFLLFDHTLTNIPGSFFFSIVLGVCLLSLILLIVKLLDERGYTLPSIQVINNHQGDDEIIVSDEEDIEDNEEVERLSQRTVSESSEANSEDILDPILEYDYDTDSINEFSDENDENNPNIINVQLPERVGRQVLKCQSSNTISGTSRKIDIEEDLNSTLCVVCQDLPKCVLALPCRHMCLCIECAHEIVNHSYGNRVTCPLCRSAIETLMNVYF